MKFYGTVLEIKNNKDGVAYAKVKDLNNQEEYVISSGGKRDHFGNTTLKVGDRVACNLKKEESKKVLSISGNIKKYQNNSDNMKAMTFGNAVNVATILFNKRTKAKKKDFGDIYKLAKSIHMEVNTHRDDVFESYPNKNPKDLGAKWGDNLKRAAELMQGEELEELFTTAKSLVELHIAYEDSLE